MRSHHMCKVVWALNSLAAASLLDFGAKSTGFSFKMLYAFVSLLFVLVVATLYTWIGGCTDHAPACKWDPVSFY